MTPARAFELAGQQDKLTALVLDHASRSINAMASTDAKSRARAALGPVREMCDEFTRLTTWLLPHALTYSPGMDEGALRAWAAAVAEEMGR